MDIGHDDRRCYNFMVLTCGLKVIFFIDLFYVVVKLVLLTLNFEPMWFLSARYI